MTIVEQIIAYGVRCEQTFQQLLAEKQALIKEVEKLKKELEAVQKMDNVKEEK